MSSFLGLLTGNERKKYQLYKTLIWILVLQNCRQSTRNLQLRFILMTLSYTENNMMFYQLLKPTRAADLGVPN